MKALGKLPRKKKAAMPRPSDTPEDGQEVEKLTDLDKLYLALADVKMETYFNTLCYSLNITSLSALKDYSAKPDKKIMDSDDMDIIKEKIGTKDFDFGQVSQRYKRSNIVETCAMKGIPVIQKQDVTVTKSIVLSPYCGFVCEALWTKSVGVKEKVCLRYEQNEDLQFLHEAEMATLLRHKNILTLHGVTIASSYSPSVALVVEFAEIGNFHESSPNCSVEQLCRFTIQAATALEHLEKNKVIHRALEEYNFLVVAKDQMKLSGFGACQFESEIEKNPDESYMYTQKGVVSQFADLFCNHFMTTFRREEYNLELLSATNEGRNCPSHYCDVFDRCLLHNPELRPSFSEIRESLVAQKYPSKVRVVTSFTAESGEFISCNTGELITLISKDRHRVDKTAWLGETEDRKVGFFKSEYVEELLGYDIMDDSTIPPEIRARGPRAERAFQKAMQNGKVKVYRGRIMLLGQDRAGKTSLKKSLLGMPFNPDEESTIGVEVDPSKCEVDVDQVKNWEPTKGKKLEASEFVEDIARLIARDLNESVAEQENISSMDSLSASSKKTNDEIDAGKLHSEASPAVLEPNQEREAAIDGPSNELPESSSQIQQEIQLNIDTTDLLPKDVTDLVVQNLQNLKLEDDIKAKEVILTLWDFAGQHLYYASHSVFLSARAVYVLVYNLSKSLRAQAEPCVRQGIIDIVLDNPNNETNLDNLLSWLVSVHGIRLTAGKADIDLNNEGANLKYRRPPVLIVGTHADQTCEDAKKMEKCIQENLLGKKYGEHVVTPFFAVDNTKSERGIGLQALREKIIEVLKQEPYMGEEVPLRWFKFEKVVEALLSMGTYYMDLDELLGYTAKVCQISDQQEFTTMLNFYHDLGVIVKHGRTVVLQAQWLIDLFKQLITVPPFEKLNKKYLYCWEDLENCGILRMALVDHVFSDFIQKGLHKQDILDMMERYGLIAKFSCLSPGSSHEQRYFVPSQLTSSPSGLCEIKPSQTDPCTLYLHFLDGFVPHGLFPQLLSRFMGWCSQRGPKPPQLYHNGGRFFIGVQTIFDLNLVCRKRYIKIVLKQRNPALGGQSSTTISETAVEVRTFLMSTLQGMSRDLSWLSNLRYELCVACPCCLPSSGQCIKHKSVCCSHDDCLHLLKVVPEEALICPKSLSEEIIQVDGLEKWFQVHKTEVNEEEMELKVLEDEAAPVVDRPLSLKGGTLTSDDLLLVAHELGTSWKMLGRALGLQPFTLDHIEEDERKLVERCYVVLRNWRQACGNSATYECLALALQDPTVGRSDLAAKYCEVCRDSSVDSTALVQPLSHKSGTPSLDVLLNVASELGSLWKMFGRALRISDPVLEQIEEDERKLNDRCYGVLTTWKEAFGSSATYEGLARALQHPVVGRSDLAVKYCAICGDASL